MKFFIINVLFVVSVLLASSDATFLWKNNPFELLNLKHALGPHESFGNPFGNPNDYKTKTIPDDIGTPMDHDVVASIQVDATTSTGDKAYDASGSDNADGAATKNAARGKADCDKLVDLSKLTGYWELAANSSGVSAMHLMLLPNINKVLMFDSTIWRISAIKLPNGECRLINKTTHETDCFAHSVLFDIFTSELTPLELHTDTWCSSGGLLLDGSLVSTGGFQGGANTARYLQQGKWTEYPTALAAPRWYSTQVTLPDGGFMVFGGRDAPSYELIPQIGKSNAAPINFPFLRETMDPEENNLYPFVHLSTDGNIFIFANNRSILLDPKTNKIVREFPVLPGGHRNYPASGMSVLLPIKLHAETTKVIPAEVLVCGGSAHIDSYSKAEKGLFYTTLQDCGRIKITDPNPVWKRELMPSPRIMGDAMILPTGDVLLLNGAKRGASGWGFAREPNFVPVLYTSRAKMGKRFRELRATTIPRMYHSTSALLPDGKILVAGSNTNNGYIYNAMFPTELRVEKFSPPYLDDSVKMYKPDIDASLRSMSYGGKVEINIKLNQQVVKMEHIMVTMYSPAFTTHGVSMNQRLINLGLMEVTSQMPGNYKIVAAEPPNGVIAPPGYYLLFAVYKGVPSYGRWVQLKY